jgi:hypothetical protein
LRGERLGARQKFHDVEGGDAGQAAGGKGGHMLGNEGR